MKTLLGLFFSLSPLFTFAQECKPDVNSCNFYLCQEAKHDCGPEGYPEGFGYKFCKIYLDTETGYSPKAHQWLRDVRVCLMEEFAKAEQDTGGSRTCDAIKSESFHSHVGCYVKTGFCELTGWDHMQIFWAMRSSLRHAEIFQDARGVSEACAARNRPIQIGL